jgi:hypothetical protein
VASRKSHQISYVPEGIGSGRARSGRPVQIRTDGFANDVAYLNRLRTALLMDGKLPHNEKAQTLEQLDRLVESLARLSHQRADQKTA